MLDNNVKKLIITELDIGKRRPSRVFFDLYKEFYAKKYNNK